MFNLTARSDIGEQESLWITLSRGFTATGKQERTIQGDHTGLWADF